MFDSTVYVSTEMILSIDALPYVASRTLDIIASIEGKFKKCLILDLDNTVWGGVAVSYTHLTLPTTSRV